MILVCIYPMSNTNTIVIDGITYDLVPRKPPPTNKYCWKCKQTKAVSEFYKDRTRYDGFGARCKPCNKKGVADWWKNKRSKAASAKNGETVPTTTGTTTTGTPTA